MHILELVRKWPGKFLKEIWRKGRFVWGLCHTPLGLNRESIRLNIVAISLRLLTKIMIFCKELWLVMKVGVSGSILKWNETTQHGMVLNEFSQAEERLQKSHVKTVLIIFVDGARIIHLNCSWRRHSEQSVCLELMERLYARTCHVKNQYFRNYSWLLLHGNTPFLPHWMWSSFLRPNWCVLFSIPSTRQIWHQQTPPLSPH